MGSLGERPVPMCPNTPGVDRRGVEEKSVCQSPTCGIKTPLGGPKNRKRRGPPEGEEPVGGVQPVVAPETGSPGAVRPGGAVAKSGRAPPKRSPEADMRPKGNPCTQKRWVQRSRRGCGRPKIEPAGSPLWKAGRIHDPSTIDQVKGGKLGYDPPQRIEEDRTLVNPAPAEGPERNPHIRPQASSPNPSPGQGGRR